MSRGGLATRTDTAALFASASARWQPLDTGLARLEQMRAADLYADSANGSTLTSSGANLKRAVDELLVAQTQNTAALATDLGNLAAHLREAVVHDGQSLRSLLLGGAGLATLLLATMLYFAWRAGRAADTAVEAQRQVEDILGTVREGLFLVARDGRIGRRLLGFAAGAAAYHGAGRADSRGFASPAGRRAHAAERKQIRRLCSGRTTSMRS